MQGFPRAPLDQFGPLGVLGPDAPVDVAGRRLTVAGWISYDDEWVEYLLSDGSWLCVEQDGGGLKFSRWWDQVDTIAPPAERQIVVDGRPYRRTEQYQARWLAAGIDGMVGPGRVHVSDYEEVADGSTALAAIEDWGDGGELSLGQVLDGALVSVPATP
jgi:hypothetical protein